LYVEAKKLNSESESRMITRDWSGEQGVDTGGMGKMLVKGYKTSVRQKE
jgi:hypothetical protein